VRYCNFGCDLKAGRRSGAVEASGISTRAAKMARLAARTLHPSLKIGSGPVPGRPACEEKLNNVSLSPSYSTGRYALFQLAAGFAIAVVFFVSIGHLRSLSDLLKNDYKLDVFIPNRLKFPINDPKTAIGGKQRFLLMKIRRQPPNCSRT
jgi:hypothetical protein